MLEASGDSHQHLPVPASAYAAASVVPLASDDRRSCLQRRHTPLPPLGLRRGVTGHEKWIKRNRLPLKLTATMENAQRPEDIDARLGPRILVGAESKFSRLDHGPQKWRVAG